jgi:S1-C subfamily serine protease
MLEQENTIYEPYDPYATGTQYVPSSTGLLDQPVVTQGLPSQYAAQPPLYPPDPVVSPPSPPKRPRRSGAMVLLALVLAVIFGIGLFAGWQFAGGSRSANTASQAATTSSSPSYTVTIPQTQQEAAIAKIEPSVVELKVVTSQGQQIGSGVIIDAQGDIVTNNHVVDGGQTIQVVLSDGRTESAQLIGTKATDDLAVVRIQPFTNMTVAQIGDSSSLVVGQNVLAVGNPLGITQTATEGIVSALNRSVTESSNATINNAIQTSAAVNPGNSGGALINLQGQLIGIPTLAAINTESNTAANGLSFAIPSNVVKADVQQILHG